MDVAIFIYQKTFYTSVRIFSLTVTYVQYRFVSLEGTYIFDFFFNNIHITAKNMKWTMLYLNIVNYRIF